MLEFLASQWGDIASAAGIFVSLIGFVCAVKVARGAQTASQAARRASQKTSARIGDHLQTVDLQRAIWLIQRIKLLHNIDRWDAALEHYQPLREMLSHIIAPRCPKGEEERQERLTRARTVFTVMDNFVVTRIRHGITESDQARLLVHLNMIQSDLEDLSGTMGFGT